MRLVIHGSWVEEVGGPAPKKPKLYREVGKLVERLNGQFGQNQQLMETIRAQTSLWCNIHEDLEGVSKELTEGKG